MNTQKLTPRPPGAVRAQPGQYFFDLASLDPIKGGPDYSSVFGGCVEGEQMIVALMRMPAGSHSQPHQHGNEQWIYVLEGEIENTVGGQTSRAGPGSLVYIPANTIHSGRCLDTDAVIFTVKDTRHGLHGFKV